MALYDVLVRPTATLRRISDNPAAYLAPSVAILAALIVLGALFPLGFFGPRAGGFAWDEALYALATGLVNALLPILGIFWIGRRWGGNRSLRRAFPTLTYCMVPVMLGGVTIRAVWGLYGLAVPEPPSTDGLTMTTWLTLVGGIIQNAAVLPLIVWALLLHVKAIRILNGFGYVRSAATLALAVLIVYAASISHGTAAVAIRELVLRV